MTPAQSFLGFEQQTLDAELAAAAAKLQAKLAEQAQRAIRKRQEEMDKNTRRWKREEAARKRNDTLTAQCGINWTTIREANNVPWGNHLVAGEGSQFPPPRCRHFLDPLPHLRPGTDLHRRPQRQAAGVRRSQNVAVAKKFRG